MNKKNLLWIVLLATGFLGSTPLMAAQSESPVTCIEGAQSVPLVYGDHTVGCEIGVVADFDGFIFDGVDGDVIRVNLRTDGFLDGRVELFDPSGTVLADTFCNAGGGGCRLIVDRTLATSGIFGVAISGVNSLTTGTYTLQVERIPPVAPQPIAYAAPTSDNILPDTDLDFFAFNAFAGNVVRVTVNTSDFLDGRLEIHDPNGAVVSNGFCNAGGGGCVVTTDQALAIDGTYTIAVSDVNILNSGDYQVNLSCLVGPCPGIIPPRPECNIELSQTSYIDGETVTANVFRYANNTGAAVALEWKGWLGVPGIPPIGIINLGADGLLVVPDGTDVDLGPLPLVPVTASLPRGSYEFSCRFLDPVTGRLLMEDRNFFDLE